MDTVASQSVPVESAQARPSQVRRVLLATDLRPISERAAEHAIALAAQAGAELIVLSVIDPASLRLPGGRFLRRVDQERARVQAEAQVLVDRARAAGVRATFLVWEGDPVETILLAAASEACDLIVVGSHGRGRLGRMVLGSVSAGLTARAPGQVVVVPPGPGSTDS
ncbi:MAG: universal stress protein [Candidatus Limnocylindrales bacterium]